MGKINNGFTTQHRSSCACASLQFRSGSMMFIVGLYEYLHNFSANSIGLWWTCMDAQVSQLVLTRWEKCRVRLGLGPVSLAYRAIAQLVVLSDCLTENLSYMELQCIPLICIPHLSDQNMQISEIFVYPKIVYFGRISVASVVIRTTIADFHD